MGATKPFKRYMVDFVFRRKKKKKEQEEGRNPHLASSRRNYPTYLNFGDCLVGVWRVSMRCLNGNLVSQDWSSQDRSSPDRTGKSGQVNQDRPSQVRTGQVRSRQAYLEIV